MNPGIIRGLLAGAAGALLGARCQVCGRSLSEAAAGSAPILCPGCARELAPRLAGYCPRCGSIFPAIDSEPHLCASCRTNPPPWREFAFCAQYQGLLRQLILEYKFNSGLGRSSLLSGLMARAWRARGLPVPDLLVPVPLHPRRLFVRGYNQSRELARGVGRILGGEVDCRTLARNRDTRPQARLPARQRKDNVSGAFSIRNDRVAGRQVVLVDDIATTGQTLGQCARVLLKAGALAVDVLVLARTGER